MFSHNQTSPTQITVGGQQAHVEAALRIAAIMAEASKRLFKVQSEAANAAFAESSNRLTTLLKTLNTQDSGALLTEWTSLYQANMRRLLDVTRSCFEIVPQTQAEISKVLGDPFASANKQTQQYLDQFTKAINDGREAAAASVKDLLATASSTASGAHTANKENVA